MAKKSKKSSKRFGNRYGKKIRDNVAAAEKGYKKSQKCPECGKKKLERVSSGIWKCGSCGAKIAGGAYSPTTEKEKILESTEESEE